MEDRETRLKRMRMRSMRRGIREMDLLLIAFADKELDGMSDAELDNYDDMLNENDQDLYAWVTGQTPAPGHLQNIINRVALTLQRN